MPARSWCPDFAPTAAGALPYETTRQTTPAFLIDHAVKIAVNTNFFDVGLSPDTDVWGLLISNGSVVSPAQSGTFSSMLTFTSSKLADLYVSATTPTGIDTAIGGAEILVSNGVNVATNPDINPRTGLGLTQDGRYLIIVIVDGRQPGWSEGVNQYEMGQWMLDFGAWDAMNCDGGGSTCMAKSDGSGGAIVYNRPSDGAPRAVGANLGVASTTTNSQGPSACSMNPNRIDMVYRGNGNNVYLETWTSTSGWAAPLNLGGTTYDSPAIVARADGHLNVFLRGTDNQLYHKYWSSGTGWSGWNALGGNLASGPAASFRDANHMDVVARGTDNSVQHIYWNSTDQWGAWESLGGTTYDAPGIVSRDSTHINVFCRGTNNHLYQKYWIGGNDWYGWVDLGGSMTSGPAACALDADHINVFFRGASSDLQQIYWSTGNNWSSPMSLSGGLAGKPAVCCRDANRLDTWVRGPQDHLYQKSWNSTSGWATSFTDLGPLFL